MAIDELDEHERSELVRGWLRQNASAILIGVAAGLALIVGYNQWQAIKRSHGDQAQAHYESLVAGIDAKDADVVAKETKLLREDYAGTPYAVFAALRIARDAVDRGEVDQALEQLTWARDHADAPALRDLANLRLARVKLAKGDAQGALDAVGEVKAASYKALAAELRGDALAALGRAPEAVTAYDDALAALDALAPQRSYVEMKRNDLSTASVPAPAAEAAASAEPKGDS
jgi:predicted negative regulator of RcsB-dependent stress response